MDDTVTIPKKEYEQLLKDQSFLACLEAAGVDNWCGYDFAMSVFYGKDDDDED